ncbi:MAG: hypothetical protein KDI38_27930, partial [Calditrichaeota bacterium]|nr:hypothetical protein [Calditrichota bacterium]
EIPGERRESLLTPFLRLIIPEFPFNTSVTSFEDRNQKWSNAELPDGQQQKGRKSSLFPHFGYDSVTHPKEKGC